MTPEVFRTEAAQVLGTPAFSLLPITMLVVVFSVTISPVLLVVLHPVQAAWRWSQAANTDLARQQGRLILWLWCEVGVSVSCVLARGTAFADVLLWLWVGTASACVVVCVRMVVAWRRLYADVESGTLEVAALGRHAPLHSSHMKLFETPLLEYRNEAQRRRFVGLAELPPASKAGVLTVIGRCLFHPLQARP
jgi:hypothetical protein